MPVNYKISKLTIDKFRGIDHLELDLPENIPVVLIGSNNAGKSTIMEALALVFKGGGMHLFTPNEYDFFHDISGHISETFKITVSFSAEEETSLPAVRGAVGNPTPVHGITVEGSFSDGRVSHTHKLIGQNGEPILLNLRVPLKGQIKTDYAGQDVHGRRYHARLDDIRDFLPEIWLLRPDNLKPSLYQWKSGPIQRLSKMLAEKFLETNWQLDYNGTTCQMPQKLIKAHDFFRSAVTNFPFWLTDLKPKIQTVISGYVGHDTKIEINPDIQAIETWLAQQLAVAFAADGSGAITPLDKLGDGWQSVVRLACLDVLGQYANQMKEKRILLFEEPETFLHPHLTKKLRKVLFSLASQGWLVMATTHSPDMISFNDSQKVVKLRRTENGIRDKSLLTSETDEMAKFQERLDERGGHEMLFAQKAIFCEGKDDYFAIRCLLEKLNVDLDGKSISIVRSGDVGTIPTYAAIAKELNIPWFAITDEDVLSDNTIKPNTKRARDKLDAIKTGVDKSVFWKKDLESCFNKTDGKATPDWINNEIQNKTADVIKINFPDYYQIGYDIKEWIA